MTTNQALRASDQDREHIVEILRAHYGEGRLTMEEFDERMGAAYQAKTWGDLLELTADLPVQLQGASEAGRAAGGDDVSAGRRSGFAFPLLPLLPLLLAVVLVSSLSWGGIGYGHYHGHPFFPVVPLLVITFLALRLRRRGRYR